MTFKNRRVLITAGPTWVRIDDVRVISNIATGETGISLANELEKQGDRVTLVLGPCVSNKIIDGHIRVINFKFFCELKQIIEKELKKNKYDVIIHSAAVSDYTAKQEYGGKIKSGIKNLRLDLKPAVKIIDRIKKLQPSVFLVGFKFEPAKQGNALFKEARTLIERSNLNLAVANTVKSGKYQAYIVSRDKASGPFLRKGIMVEHLIKHINRVFAGR